MLSGSSLRYVSRYVSHINVSLKCSDYFYIIYRALQTLVTFARFHLRCFTRHIRARVIADDSVGDRHVERPTGILRRILAAFIKTITCDIQIYKEIEILVTQDERQISRNESNDEWWRVAWITVTSEAPGIQ